LLGDLAVIGVDEGHLLGPDDLIEVGIGQLERDDRFAAAFGPRRAEPLRRSNDRLLDGLQQAQQLALALNLLRLPLEAGP